MLLELARELEDADPELDVALLAFGKEELPAEFSPSHSFDNSRLVHEAGLAILLEPTDCTIQAGCLGNLNARITFHGVSGHSARPWTTENAIDKAPDAASGPYAAIEPRPVEIGGLTFTEVASVTQIEGGIATNVIPDRVVANVNFRYAPDRSPSSARRVPPQPRPRRRRRTSTPRLAARARRHRPAAVQRPGSAGDLALEPKQARMNVADFIARTGCATSAQGRRATPNAATSRSRSPRWSAASGRSGRSSPVAFNMPVS